MLTIALIVAALAAAAYIRMAPADPARWHTDPGSLPVTDCTALTTTRSTARVTCLHPDPPAVLLARLDEIALASPRTRRLAGSAETGRITWESRSTLWGFPDYTTAQATAVPDGTRLDIQARSRFGDYDWGVNAGRLKNWLTRL